MKHKGSCLACQSLVIAFTNALQTSYDKLFSHLNVSSRATPKAVWKKHLGHCVYCGQETDWKLRGGKKLKNAPEIDHWIPISLGGPPTTWNMLLACKSCNSSKGDKLWPYPPALLKRSPELTSCTKAAKELADTVWGGIVSTNKGVLSYCETMSYISKRWSDSSTLFGSKFPKLSRYINTWQSNQCASMSASETECMASILERETERELYG